MERIYAINGLKALRLGCSVVTYSSRLAYGIYVLGLANSRVALLGLFCLDIIRTSSYVLGRNG